MSRYRAGRHSLLAMRRLLLPIACAVLVLGACSEPIPDDAPGAEIYRISCAPCHGAELQGRSGPRLGGEEAPSIDLSRDYFVDTITRGRGRMPAFGNRLSEAQIDRVVDFVLERQGRAP